MSAATIEKSIEDSKRKKTWVKKRQSSPHLKKTRNQKKILSTQWMLCLSFIADAIIDRSIDFNENRICCLYCPWSCWWHAVWNHLKDAHIYGELDKIKFQQHQLSWSARICQTNHHKKMRGKHAITYNTYKEHEQEQGSERFDNRFIGVSLW